MIIPTILDAKKQVVIMYVARNGMTGGIAGVPTGETVAQVRARIRNTCNVRREAPTLLNGKPIIERHARKKCVRPGDEIWLGGWKPP